MNIRSNIYNTNERRQPHFNFNQLTSIIDRSWTNKTLLPATATVYGVPFFIAPHRLLGNLYWAQDWSFDSLHLHGFAGATCSGVRTLSCLTTRYANAAAAPQTVWQLRCQDGLGTRAAKLLLQIAECNLYWNWNWNWICWQVVERVSSAPQEASPWLHGGGAGGE